MIVVVMVVMMMVVVVKLVVFPFLRNRNGVVVGLAVGVDCTFGGIDANSGCADGSVLVNGVYANAITC